MIRSALRLCLLLFSAALLTGLLSARTSAQNGPALSVKFGIAGRYKPGGWCLATVTVRNPGPDTIDGQLQILSSGDPQNNSRRFNRSTTPAAVTFACPVSVPGGSAAPHSYPLYLHGVDPSSASLTVQLAEGRERGDGRVLAKISTDDPQPAVPPVVPVFSGGAIGPRDRLLVGFGGDPSAFMFLNGRQINTGNPSTLQVAEAAAAADLPDKAAGYDGVETFLLRGDAPVDALTEAQVSALKGWVAGGGHLVVTGGSDPTRFSAAFFEGLLPATVGGTGAGGTLILTPKPLPGVQAVPSAGAAPQVISGPYGAGWVTLTAFDPTALWRSPGLLPLPSAWKTLLASRAGTSVLGTAASQDNRSRLGYYGNGQSALSGVVMRGPSLDAPGTMIIAAFLLVYLIVLVPVNYLVLKRLDRKEWAWGTIPALVLLFAAGTFAVGYAAKGGTVFVNRAAIIETTAGHSEAGAMSALGLFSPHRTAYDLTLSGTNLAAAVPSPSDRYNNSGTESPSAGPAQIVQTQAGASLPSTPVNMWAMRSFDVSSTTSLGGTIDGTLTTQGGTVVNHTAYTLTDCAVYYSGKWHKIGTLAPGASLTLANADMGSPNFPVPAMATPDGTAGTVQDRMHLALGQYFASLGQAVPDYNDDGNAAQAYLPAPSEAVLAGWCRDPAILGPKPLVDGRAVTENDLSLVVVHLPMGK